jgi:hypothetical protein
MKLCSQCGARHGRSDRVCPACGAFPAWRNGVFRFPRLGSAIDEFSCHSRRYTRSELLRTTRAAGFARVDCTSCLTLTLPAVVASRRLPRRRRFDPAAALRLPRTLNGCLNVLQECESWLVEMGLSLPLGSSLRMGRPPA